MMANVSRNDSTGESLVNMEDFLVFSILKPVCKLWTQEPENFDEEVMSLVTAW